MKTLYFDCGMGAAGDMLTAALLELLPDPDSFIDRLNNLNIPNIQFMRENSKKCGINGSHVRVIINGHEEHKFISSQGDKNKTDISNTHIHHHGQNISDIKHTISHIDIPENVRLDVLNVYKILAEAESKVHGVSVSDIHFHEVGTLDAIADITAVSLLINEISPDRIIASPVHVGSGYVKCAHGTIPVPAPATALILKNIPIYGGNIDGELCTPTGAALLKHFVDSFGNMPQINISSIGYGMGEKDFSRANCIRAILGESIKASDNYDTNDIVFELSCNVDDMTAEAIGFAMDRLFEGGALEVYTIPVGMKKSRPGTLIRVMCREKDRKNILHLIFKHTTTIGIREVKTRRYVLDRKIRSITTPYGEIHSKISCGYGVSRTKYEYEDLSRIAKERNLSLNDVKNHISNTSLTEHKDRLDISKTNESDYIDKSTHCKKLTEKKKLLEKYLKGLGSVAVAFSSGVDSTFLLKVAHDVLGEKAAAVTAVSPSFPSRELEEAKAFCKKEKIRHIIVNSDIISNEEFIQNPENRCYICKHTLLLEIKSAAEKNGFSYVIEGSNIDDTSDYRPGLIAISELDVKSPLIKSALTKDEIRILSKEAGLLTWDKPSYACLVSRIPYGETITKEKLSIIEKAEQKLIDMGLRQVRVRIHEDSSNNLIARIETKPSDFNKVISPDKSEYISKYLKGLGFLYVTLDFDGYRAGSMNPDTTK